MHQSRAWTDAGSRGYEIVLRPTGRCPPACTTSGPATPSPSSRHRAAPGDRGRTCAHLRRLEPRRRPPAVPRRRAAATRIVAIGWPRTSTYDKRRQPPISRRCDHLARASTTAASSTVVDDLQVFDVRADRRPKFRRRCEPARRRDKRHLREHYLARSGAASTAAPSAELHAARRGERPFVAAVPRDHGDGGAAVAAPPPSPRARRLRRARRHGRRRDTPAVPPPLPPMRPRNRLGLARWLTIARHPLTARVAVNRVWQHALRPRPGRHARGLRQPGAAADRIPSCSTGWRDRFMDTGWDVKALHEADRARRPPIGSRRRHAAELHERDPDNRAARARPDASAAGRADPRQRARRQRAARAGRSAARASSRTSRRACGSRSRHRRRSTRRTRATTLYRRSLYTFWKRTSPPPSMTTFDAVSREVCAARGEVTSTPLQALVLLNDPQFVEAARALAERMLQASGATAAARHRAAFRALDRRAPDAREATLLRAAVHRAARHFRAGRRQAAEALLGVGRVAAGRVAAARDFAAMTARRERDPEPRRRHRAALSEPGRERP